MGFRDMLDNAAAATARRLGISLAVPASHAGKFIQPLEMIPGMTNAAEIGPLLGKWNNQSGRWWREEKIDGIRAFYMLTRIISREALPLDCALHCIPALSALEASYGQPMVFDGEYQAPGGYQDTLAEHKRGEGCGTFHVFDAVPYAEWRRNRFTMRLEDRKAMLERHCDAIGPRQFLRYVPAEPGIDDGNILHAAQNIWAKGGEGLVLKRAGSLYDRARTGAWLKLKQQHVTQIHITDFALNLHGDRVKAIIGEMIEGGVVNIGSNIPEDLRREIARDTEAWTGAYAEIGYTERTASGALRGAYFNRIVRMK